MARNSGLGKGLDALILPSEGGLSQSGITSLSVDLIRPNPRQPRTVFNKDNLSELADSIREHGILQPLIISNGERANEYILIAGERRLKAAKLAELVEVPVIFRDASDQELLELALIENVQRADLSALETAMAYQQLKADFDLSDKQIAKRVGKSRVAVTNTRSLLELSKTVRNALEQAQISEGHARALKPLSAQSQSAALKAIISKSLNVRQTEELVRSLKGNKPSKKPVPSQPSEILNLEGQLRDALGTKVSLKHGAKGGKIVIHYYSDEELNGLAERLMGKD